ncbi:MAG: zinc ribbon domain-containing protein [Peptococcaceae bacterium]|jgi:hypothetical protein|nr:zinc ribbon domain-containing protein [Peptococcaceae bacterium]
MFCEKCGAQFDKMEKFCSKCGAPNPASQPASQPVQTGATEASTANSGDGAEWRSHWQKKENQASPYSAGAGTVNGADTPVLAKEEHVVKTYHCSQLRFPSCDGYLSVTNRRVIFHGYAAESRIVDEAQLDSVSGLSTFYGGKLKVGQLIAGIIMACVSIWSLAQAASRSLFSQILPTWLSVVLLGVAVLLFITCYRRMFFLKVYSSKANGSPIAIGEGYGGFGGNGAVFTVTASPTGETDAMMRELGALISDLQRMGDYGTADWGKDE